VNTSNRSSGKPDRNSPLICTSPFLHDVETGRPESCPPESGSSFTAKYAAIGARQQSIVNGQFVRDVSGPRLAALIGSISPIMSAIVTSGVANFSTYRSSGVKYAMGVSFLISAINSRHRLQNRCVRVIMNFAPGDIGNCIVKQSS